jgi:tRNA(Ile)-lysidine synthase
MNLYQTLDAYVQNHALIAANQTIIIALSGGPDSVFLLHYLVHLQKTYNLTLIAAHLDHEWRTTSVDDARFCEQLCARLGITLVMQKLSALPGSPSPVAKTEEMGRIARRIFFEQLTTTYNAHSVALAHHHDDQQETFFIRLMRGASLTGLCSMRPHSGIYIRPLLAIDKKDIVAFLDAHNYAYVIDPTNACDVYLRNRLRNNLMPLLQEIDPRWQKNFAKTLEQLQETEQFLEKFTITLFNDFATLQPDGTYRLNLAVMRAMDKVMQYRLLVYWLVREQLPFPVSQGFLDELIRFIMHPHGGTHALTPQWQIKKEKNSLFIQTTTTIKEGS